MAPVTAAAVLAVWLAVVTVKRPHVDLPPAAPPPTDQTSASRDRLLAPSSAAVERAAPEMAREKMAAPRVQRPKREAEAERQDAKAAAPPSVADQSADAASERVTAPAAAQAAPNVSSRLERRMMMLDAGARPTILIASPVASTQWRISRGATVERTADGGRTWELQDIGVTMTPTAGASPSPLVCWLVGPQGLVLLTTDGHSWKRAPFPDDSDLMWVRASDARTATVTSQSGGTWTTQDGGATWTRQ
jgi:hypothetical protein